MSAESFAERLHSQRGVKISIRCSKAASAERIGEKGFPGSEKLSAKIVYIGPASGETSASAPEGFRRCALDRYACAELSSPCGAEPDPDIAAVILKSSGGDLWFAYYFQVYMKDPEISQSGLRVRLLVPKAVADKGARVSIMCNGQTVFEDAPEDGIIDAVIDIAGTDPQMCGYLEDVHRQQMLLLREIDRVCSRNGLRYYLCCGSLIGALRDGDFVPWDDDLDICMPREDFDALMELVEKEWPEGSDFCLLRPGAYGRDFFLDFMTRLVYMKETVGGDPFARIPQGLPWHGHLPMDIYVLDKASDSKAAHSLRARHLQMLYGMSLSRRKGLDRSAHKDLGKAALIVSGALCAAGRLLCAKTLLRRANRVARALEGRFPHLKMTGVNCTMPDGLSGLHAATT